MSYYPTYVSPGAAFSSGMENFMAQRAAQKHQDLLDSLAQKREDRLAQAEADTAQERRDALQEHKADREEEAHNRKVKAFEAQTKDMVKGDIPSMETFHQAQEVGQANQQFPAPPASAPGMMLGRAEVGPTTEMDPSARPFIGNAPERIAIQGRQREMDLGAALTGVTDRATAVQTVLKMGVPYAQVDDVVNAHLGKPATGARPTSIQEYEYNNAERAKTGLKPLTYSEYQDEDANRKKTIAAGGENARPYFTPQTEYDAQGRPVGAMAFNSRTGTAARIVLPEGGNFKPPLGTLGPQTISNEAAQDALQNMITQFEEGGKELVGPVSGRLYQTGQKIPGVPVNKTFAKFDAASSAFRNAAIKAITGAQMSEVEADRIRQQIPEITDKPEVWIEKAHQTMQNLALLEKRVRTDRDAKTPKSKYKVTVE